MIFIDIGGANVPRQVSQHKNFEFMWIIRVTVQTHVNRARGLSETGDEHSML